MILSQCRRAAACGLSALILAAGAAPAIAGTFPERPVKLVVAGPPSGGTDFLARLLAERLTALWKQPVALMNGTTAPLVTTMALIWPPIRSVSAGLLPRYGTWRMSTPASCAMRCPSRCCGSPMPGEP